MNTYQLMDSSSKLDTKKIRLKGKRILQYVRFTKDDEESGAKEVIINESIGYVLVDDLKKENTTQKEEKDLQENIENELSFCNEGYVIYKNEFSGKLEPEYITEYVKRDEHDNYKLNSSLVKGYLLVQHMDKNPDAQHIQTVLIVSKKKFFPFLLFFFLLFLGTVSAYAFHNPKSADVPVAESPMIEFAEDATEYDDSPVMIGEPEPEVDTSNSELKFNVFVDNTIKSGDKIPFANYSSNVDNIEFYVTYAGETDVIYESGVLKPGSSVDWDVASTLGSGNYFFDIYMAVYPENGSEPSYTRCQKNFNLTLL